MATRSMLPALAAVVGLHVFLTIRPDAALDVAAPAMVKRDRPAPADGFDDGCNVATPLWASARTKALCVPPTVSPISASVQRSAQTTTNTNDKDDAVPWAMAGLWTGVVLMHPSAAWIMWAWATAATGVWMLATDRHFWWPVCALLSLNYWAAAAWIGGTVSTEIGVGLAVMAFAMRASVLLFPLPEGGQLRAKSSTVRTLLSHNRAYAVPAYQRDYRWSVSHVTKLLTDVRRSMNMKDPHFLIGPIMISLDGAAFMNKEGTGDADEGEFEDFLDMHSLDKNEELVDGQQRVTTLLLTLGAYLNHLLSRQARLDELLQAVRAEENDNENARMKRKLVTTWLKNEKKRVKRTIRTVESLLFLNVTDKTDPGKDHHQQYTNKLRLKPKEDGIVLNSTSINFFRNIIGTPHGRDSFHKGGEKDWNRLHERVRDNFEEAFRFLSELDTETTPLEEVDARGVQLVEELYPLCDDEDDDDDDDDANEVDAEEYSQDEFITFLLDHVQAQVMYVGKAIAPKSFRQINTTGLALRTGEMFATTCCLKERARARTAGSGWDELARVQAWIGKQAARVLPDRHTRAERPTLWHRIECFPQPYSKHDELDDDVELGAFEEFLFHLQTISMAGQLAKIFETPQGGTDRLVVQIDEQKDANDFFNLDDVSERTERTVHIPCANPARGAGTKVGAGEESKLTSWITGPRTEGNSKPMSDSNMRGTFYGAFAGMLTDWTCHNVLWNLVVPSPSSTMTSKWFPQMAKTMRNLFLVKHHEWRAVVMVAVQAITSRSPQSADAASIAPDFVGFVQGLESLAILLTFREIDWRKRSEYAVRRRRRYGALINKLHNRTKFHEPAACLKSFTVLSASEQKELAADLESDVYNSTIHRGHTAFLLLVVYESTSNAIKAKAPSKDRNADTYGVVITPKAKVAVDGYADYGDDVDHIVARGIAIGNCLPEWFEVNAGDSSTSIDKWQHKLGNLCLLSASNNRSLRNEAPDGAQKIYALLNADYTRTRELFRPVSAGASDGGKQAAEAGRESRFTTFLGGVRWGPRECAELHNKTVKALCERWDVRQADSQGSSSKASGGVASSSKVSIDAVSSAAVAAPSAPSVVYKTYAVIDMRKGKAKVAQDPPVESKDDLCQTSGDGCNCPFGWALSDREMYIETPYKPSPGQKASLRGWLNRRDVTVCGRRGTVDILSSKDPWKTHHPWMKKKGPALASPTASTAGHPPTGGAPFAKHIASPKASSTPHGGPPPATWTSPTAPPCSLQRSDSAGDSAGGGKRKAQDDGGAQSKVTRHSGGAP